MPELPDVEVYRRYVDATSLHQPVQHVHVADDEVLDDVTRQKLAARLHGHVFDRTRRHGKHLGVSVSDDGWLLLHFGMTGELAYCKSPDHEPEHVKARFDFRDGGRLAYQNQRKLGRVRLVDDFDSFIEKKQLGQDAMDISLKDLRRLMENRRGSVKPQLMNQAVIAGVGNVYADETLFHAGVRPSRNVQSLTSDETAALHRSLRRVMRTAIRHKAQPEEMPRSWLLPRRTSGATCPKCNGKLRQDAIAGRTSYWRPTCQR